MQKGKSSPSTAFLGSHVAPPPPAQLHSLYLGLASHQAGPLHGQEAIADGIGQGVGKLHSELEGLVEHHRGQHLHRGGGGEGLESQEQHAPPHPKNCLAAMCPAGSAGGGRGISL